MGTNSDCHVSEDEFLWPRRAERTALHAGAITRMEEQHHRLEEVVTRVRDALDTGWPPIPGRPSASRWRLNSPNWARC
ncbi:hypothetical protein ACGFY9_47465 [Streptomyces sp. NPDC048504]|uniref:hypothetical protein n=1 Tax=Streptomyces sp. NPDC048504 TaxID=3365559 RepID=UPI003714E69B